MLKRQSCGSDGPLKVTFVLPASEPEGPVSVLGSFNDWNPLIHPLTKRSNGIRSVTVEVPAGARCSEAPRCAPYARTLARSDLAERLFLP